MPALKRNSFSLLEILIALPLLALFISIGVGSYIHMVRLRQKDERVSALSKEEHYFHRRIRRMLTACNYEDLNLEVSENMLSFDTHNGVHENPEHSGGVHAEMLLEKGQLLLKVMKDEEIVRKEHYFSGLKQMQCLFGYANEGELGYQKDIDQTQAPLCMKLELDYTSRPSKSWMIEF